ncbi:MAG: nucleotide exchange factor GrpE, partial [Patescibacteria group bacterium]
MEAMKEPENDNEIVPEELDDSVVAEESSQASIKKLKERIKECEAKAKEYLDGWQRAQADFVNLRKRDEEAKVEFLKFANADLISQLIPVLDSLNLAKSHAEPIYKQLLQILKQNGLEELNPMGMRFNPREHESIGVIKTENKDEDHKILEVVQKGYILQGKIIRPARVRIG